MTKALKKKSPSKLTGVRYINIGRPRKFIHWSDFEIY